MGFYMPNILDMFTIVRHRYAYNELMNYPISSAIDQMQDEFPQLNLHGITETTLENNYPTTKLTISNAANIGAVFVVFNSPYAKYGVGRKNPNGDLDALQTANTCEEAKEAVKAKFRELLGSWQMRF
jgi:hypothetical protein